MPVNWLNRYTIHQGDSRQVLKGMADASVDSIVCDPPYELGFMGKSWDNTGIANDVTLWREALRVLKPGGHMLAFSGTRTYHRMVCAIEDAGFEIRDQLGWVFGSGFPKSLDVSKAIDKAAGVEREVTRQGQTKAPEDAGKFDSRASAERERRDEPATDEATRWQGWGTALKPAWEPIVMARKPLVGTVAANVLQHGTGALNIDACRVLVQGEAREPITGRGAIPARHTEHEAREAGIVAQPHELGRWPANLIHDGSDEVVALFPESTSGAMRAGTQRAAQDEPGSVCFGTYGGNATSNEIAASSGSAARFFYCAKASKEDRNEGCDGLPLKTGGMVSNTSGQHITRRDGGAPGPTANHHPTVKPTDLMAYLCRLVTPPGGIVLDPFMGSGSTGKAAMLEGFNFIGIDLSAEYIEIARARIDHALRQGHQPSLLEAA